MRVFSYLVILLYFLCNISVAQENNKRLGSEAEIESILSLSEMDISYGDKNAPIVIVEYSCLACPGCAYQQENIFPILKAKYIDSGKVLWIKRFLPKNKQSFDASRIIYCLRRDPKLEKYIEILFQKQFSWSSDKNYIEILESIFKLSHVSGEKVQQCLGDKKIEDWMNLIRIQALYKIGLEATPTIFMNGKKLSGEYRLGFLKSSIEEELSR